MMPFDAYLQGGREPIGRLPKGKCRRGYGLKLQRIGHQTTCAYCDTNLVDAYEHWLLLSVDHVIPVRAGENAGIRKDWLEDAWNTVICCSACNGFGNRYELPDGTIRPQTFDDFVRLRDATFRIRKEIILGCHAKEKEFYQQRPWEDHA